MNEEIIVCLRLKGRFSKRTVKIDQLVQAFEETEIQVPGWEHWETTAVYVNQLEPEEKIVNKEIEI